MKLAKLSLAAILAAGTFSVANATSLENAIKGVTLNGMLRVRFYNESPKNGDTYNRWRTNGIFIFGVPVGDNLKIVYRASTQTNVYADDDQLNPGTQWTEEIGPDGINSATFNNLLYLQYSNGPTNVIAGKIPVSTPITSADPVTPGEGAGVIASYNVGNGFTVAGAYVDALEASETMYTSVDGEPRTLGDLGATPSDTALGNTIYAVAAMYKNDMVNAQAWYFHAVNLLKYVYTVQATVTPVAGVTLHGDFATSKLDGGDVNSKTYYNLSAGYAANGFSGMIGYASTDKDVGVISLGDDAPIGCVLPTATITNISNLQDVDAWYGKVGYDVNAKTNVYVAYTNINQAATVNDATANNDSNEYTVGAGYKYNKKLSFATYYDVLNYSASAEANGNVDNNEFRFEAKYIF